MFKYEKANGDVVEAVQWDGVGLPPECPVWLTSGNGQPLHVENAIMQSGDTLFVNTQIEVLRARPTDYLVLSNGAIYLWPAEAFNATYTLVTEPDPAPEEAPIESGPA